LVAHTKLQLTGYIDDYCYLFLSSISIVSQLYARGFFWTAKI
jgi:hypothetical protein